jgi:hypothetical protein
VDALDEELRSLETEDRAASAGEERHGDGAARGDEIAEMA